mgnify:CR=1 FL=1
MKSTALLIGFLFCFIASTSSADNLVSSANRTRIGLNETLNLVLEYDEQVDSRQLDFSALQQDFEILNSSTASQVSIINGRQDVSTRWTLILLPKRAGAALIPSFQIDGNFSEAIAIEVLESTPTASRSQPLSVELEVSDTSLTTLEQLIVTVRLIAAPQVSNLSGDGLSIEGAEATLLDQSQYSEVVNGSNWQINEWKYAIFVDQPGTLEIPGQLFSGVIGSTRSIFDSFGGGGQRTLARSPNASVEVSPAPTGRYWFPAREVLIEEDWPDSTGGTDEEFRVGEPITRSISIIAFGQRPETIPPLPEVVDDQFKIYADQPELITQTQEDYLVGIRSESAAIVPTRAGQMTLPEIRIPWWDTDESVWKEAVLPAKNINILEAQSSASLAPPENFSQPVQLVESEEGNLFGSSSVWFWSTTAFALLSLVLALLLVRRPTAKAGKTAIREPNSKEQQLWASLRRELKGNSAQNIRSALENWCRAIWSQESASPLQRLSEKLSAEAAAELAALEQAIYGMPEAPLPKFEALQAELKVLRKNTDTKADTQDPLPPLNPI